MGGGEVALPRRGYPRVFVGLYFRKQVTEILEECPDLKPEEIQQALEYASWVATNRSTARLRRSDPTRFVGSATVGPLSEIAGRSMDIEQIRARVRAHQYVYTHHAEIERRADELTLRA